MLFFTGASLAGNGSGGVVLEGGTMSGGTVWSRTSRAPEEDFFDACHAVFPSVSGGGQMTLSRKYMA
ncbi:hypothetical protein GCM10010271_71020 [Streptomyces kurssanovii]|nr:hypothetical protein GCM10010271_71020 [Streptomyces kurssanovii]